MYKYTLQIDGMMCGMCEAHVNDVVRHNTKGKLKKLKSNHHKNICTFLSEDENIDEIVNGIKEQGYHVLDVKKEEK